MKHIYTIMLLMLSSTVFAQEPIELPIMNGTVTYTDTISSEQNQGVLYTNLKLWAARTFPTKDISVTLDSPRDGKFIAKCIIRPYFTYIGKQRFSDIDLLVGVDVRDNKYRYIFEVVKYYHEGSSKDIDDLIRKASGRRKFFSDSKNYSAKELQLVDKSIKDLISSLKEGMAVNDVF